MRKFAGSVNHRFYPDDYQATSMFIAAFKFLSGTNCKELGVSLIAYNTGSIVSGAINYPNYYSGSVLQSSVGSNAWACFRFSSATNPFYVLIQSSEPSVTFGSTPGNPATTPIESSNGMFAFAGAALEDGGNAWNGTSFANGNDVKGNPVWNTSSYCFPRQNNLGGASNSTKQAMMSVKVNATANTQPMYWYGIHDVGVHFIADQNNFAIFHELGSGIRMHYFHWIGKYIAIASNNSPLTLASISNVSTSFCNSLAAMSEIYDYGGGNAVSNGLYGGINGLGFSTRGGDGGIAFKSGSTGLVKTLNVDWYMMAKNWNAHPNLVANKPMSTFNPANVFLLVAESPYYGVAGFVDFFKFVSEVPSQSTFNDNKWAFLPGGSLIDMSSPESHPGIVIPWDSSAKSPGTYFGREGVQFIRSE